MRFKAPYRILASLITTSTSTAFFGSSSLEKEIALLATSLRQKIPTLPPNQQRMLYYPSSFSRSPDKKRGFCNWLIPNLIMLGQYPGCSPERSGPTELESRNHLTLMVRDADVSLFCSLQSEIPDQNDDELWGEHGEVYLPQHLKDNFPGPFTHYAPTVRSLDPKVTFYHAPIKDLNVPNSKPLLRLLSYLLHAMDEEGRIIYLHCWGGRGRAGLVGACLISLLYPTLEAEQILTWVQSGYDARDGSEDMPPGLRRSPQTKSQRDFVRKFVMDVKKFGGE